MLDNLQKWTPLAELAGAIAVVITLGFLVAEMRANTNAVQAQTYQDLMQQLNDYRMMLGEPVRAEATARLGEVGWQGLSQSEQMLVRTPSMIRWGIYEAAYYANVRGVLGDQEWERFRVGICRSLDTQGALWDPGDVTPMTELLTPAFVDFIADLCGELP